MVIKFRVFQHAGRTEISLEPEYDLRDAELRHGNRIGAPRAEHMDSAGKERTGEIIRGARRIKDRFQGRHPVKLGIGQARHAPCGKNDLCFFQFAVLDIYHAVNPRQEIRHRLNFPELVCGIDIINLGWIYGQNRCFVFFHFTFFS